MATKCDTWLQLFKYEISCEGLATQPFILRMRKQEKRRSYFPSERCSRVIDVEKTKTKEWVEGERGGRHDEHPCAIVVGYQFSLDAFT